MFGMEVWKEIKLQKEIKEFLEDYQISFDELFAWTKKNYKAHQITAPQLKNMTKKQLIDLIHSLLNNHGPKNQDPNLS